MIIPVNLSTEISGKCIYESFLSLRVYIFVNIYNKKQILVHKASVLFLSFVNHHTVELPALHICLALKQHNSF